MLTFHVVLYTRKLVLNSVLEELLFAYPFVCFSQAAILCQFLDEVDYATAFRCLQERSCNDAMDSLYQFMWDVTMLEFIIQLHHKRGETHRKAVAVTRLNQKV